MGIGIINIYLLLTYINILYINNIIIYVCYIYKDVHSYNNNLYRCFCSSINIYVLFYNLFICEISIIFWICISCFYIIASYDIIPYTIRIIVYIPYMNRK